MGWVSPCSTLEDQELRSYRGQEESLSRVLLGESSNLLSSVRILKFLLYYNIFLWLDQSVLLVLPFSFTWFSFCLLRDVIGSGSPSKTWRPCNCWFVHWRHQEKWQVRISPLELNLGLLIENQGCRYLHLSRTQQELKNLSMKSTTKVEVKDIQQPSSELVSSPSSWYYRPTLTTPPSAIEVLDANFYDLSFSSSFLRTKSAQM